MDRDRRQTPSAKKIRQLFRELTKTVLQIRSLIAMLSLNAAATDFAATTHHVFGDNIFSLDAPESFSLNTNSDTFQLTAPDDVAAITASAYAKADGTLRDFCIYRFSSVEDFYKPAAEVTTIKTDHASGEFQEFEGIWPGESTPTYYVVSCLQVGDVYVSLNIVTTHAHYQQNRTQYLRIFESVRPGP